MKLELHEHISRLLYDHECVVVPGFGAFLTRYHAAEINHATHMMRPPSRRVYFNPSIRENDGLLAKSISYLEKLGYSSAQAEIERKLSDWKLTLNAGKKLNLPGIGRLYFDESKRLQFSPSLEINYSPSSYGLSIFRSPAIQREAEIRKSINKAIEKHVVIEHPETKKKKVAAWVPWAAVLGPVILASIIGYSYYTGRFNPLENVAGLNPFNYSRSIDAQHTTAAPAKADAATEEMATPEVPITTAEEGKTPVADVTTPTEVKQTDLTETASSASMAEGRFHIVVGSFKEAGNANQYISELQAKGYHAYMAPGDNRFNRVAIGNFKTREQALDALLGVKQSIQPASWIYAN